MQGGKSISRREKQESREQKQNPAWKNDFLPGNRIPFGKHRFDGQKTEAPRRKALSLDGK